MKILDAIKESKSLRTQYPQAYKQANKEHWRLTFIQIRDFTTGCLVILVPLVALKETSIFTENSFTSWFTGIVILITISSWAWKIAWPSTKAWWKFSPIKRTKELAGIA